MPARFDELYRFGTDDFLTAEALNKRNRDIDLRIAGLEALKVAWEEALRVVNDRVLAQSEAVIGDLRDQLLALTQLQWLTAHSTSTQTLTLGETKALAILPEDRELFAPGPYAVISRASTPDDYAVVRSITYDREMGQWVFAVEAVAGDPGPHSDWVIAALAGSTLAQMTLLDQAQAVKAATEAARDAAIAARDAAGDKAEATAADRAAVAEDKAAVADDRQAIASDKDAAQGYRDAAQASAAAAAAAAASIAGGPVASVAGLSGVVTAAGLKSALGIAADIAAATAALVAAAPGQLDTLNELAAALGDDANFAATVTAALAAKADASAVPTRGGIVGLSYGDTTFGY